MIYERTHSRQIADNIGLTARAVCDIPRHFALSSLGLPGTNSFVGEFMILAGTILWSKIATAFASLGIILAAAYLLWMVQRVAFGVPAPHMLPKLRDVNLREMVTLVPLALLIFMIGLFPNPILTRMHPASRKSLEDPCRRLLSSFNRKPRASQRCRLHDTEAGAKQP